MKITLIGAGSAQFGYSTMGEIFQSTILKGAEIVLMDINAKALDTVYRTGMDFIQNHGLDFSLSATTHRAHAIKNADFVIISIEVGDRFKQWDQDWKIPMQFGVHQVYGENGGPGGVFHALRIIPPILEICEDINRLSPSAIVFNYSNPMTAITTTVLRKYPEMKFIGMCHEIASLKRCLPHILNTPFENLHIRAAGLNHFSVLLEAKYKDTGKDAYDDIRAKAAAYFEKEPGYSEIWDYVQRTGNVPKTEGVSEQWRIDTHESKRPWTDRHLFRVLFETYGLLPITLDSHLGEYISWAQDTVDHKGILDFYEFYRHALSTQSWAEISTEVHERVIPIMEGVITDAGFEELAVNLMNNGAIPDFPNCIAVEVPGIVHSGGVRAVRFDTYPKGFGALMRNYAGVYDLTAEAVLNQSRDLVIQALLACPVVHDFHRMPALLDTMIERQSQWLGYLL